MTDLDRIKLRIMLAILRGIVLLVKNSVKDNYKKENYTSYSGRVIQVVEDMVDAEV